MDVDAFFKSIVLPEKWRVLERWDEYMRMVEWVENLPENQSGADKSWVERADRLDREFFETIHRFR